MARPQLEFIPTGPSRAMIFKIDQDIWPVYHYHPEYDILLSLKDHGGEYLSGDHIGRLRRGTLIMNGNNLHDGLTTVSGGGTLTLAGDNIGMTGGVTLTPSALVCLYVARAGGAYLGTQTG